jgi:hypothetical protein
MRLKHKIACERMVNEDLQLDAVKLAAESPARLQKIAPGEPGEVK